MRISRADRCPIEHLRGQSTVCVSGSQAGLPRLWPQLPAEKQWQLAQQIGRLLQRLRPASARETEKHHADHGITL